MLRYRALLVVLYLELLAAKRPKTGKDFHDWLTRIGRGSDGLRGTYIAMWEQILQQDDEEEVELAKNVFVWVSFSGSRLTIQQLQHALAAQSPEISAISEDVLYTRSLITEPCLGLFTVNEDQIIDFMHPTAREFYPEYLREVLKDAQAKLCGACLRYISLSDIGPCDDSNSIECCLVQFPFLGLAATKWSTYAMAVDEDFTHHELLP